MARTKKTEKTVKAPKAPALKKDGTPRAKPVRKAPLDRFADKVNKYAVSETAAVKRAESLTKTFVGIEKTLAAWGHPVPENASITEVQDAVSALVAAGFDPPKGRVKSDSFSEGTPVQLKPDFVTAYLSVYSQEEITSMVYSFYDDVNKRAMCTTAGRVMAVKPSHLEPFGTVHAVPVAA